MKHLSKTYRACLGEPMSRNVSHATITGIFQACIKNTVKQLIKDHAQQVDLEKEMVLVRLLDTDWNTRQYCQDQYKHGNYGFVKAFYPSHLHLI